MRSRYLLGAPAAAASLGTGLVAVSLATGRTWLSVLGVVLGGLGITALPLAVVAVQQRQRDHLVTTIELARELEGRLSKLEARLGTQMARLKADLSDQASTAHSELSSAMANISDTSTLTLIEELVLLRNRVEQLSQQGPNH